MLIFIDTEFTDFVQIDLISIVIVPEDDCGYRAWEEASKESLL